LVLISMINIYTLAASTPQYWIDYDKRQYSLVEKRQWYFDKHQYGFVEKRQWDIYR
ncbi:22289_t:CDS:1, partial [Racocetra persica]